MSLHEASVLVKLTLRRWDGFVKDKRAAERIDEDFRTSGGVGNYNKRLMDKAILSPIQKVCSSMYSEHTRLTVPWCYDGVSLLPSKLFLEYSEIARDHKDRLETAVNNLYTQFPIHKANQISRLGDLFVADEYPTAEELRAKHEISWQFFPVPAAGHFAVDLEADSQERLKSELTASLATVQSAAVSDLYDRVNNVLACMHERLSDPGNIFRDTLVTNVQQLVDVLPALNMFNDSKLDQACARIKQQVLVAEPQDLRDDLALRERVANEAFDILNFMKERAA